MKDLTIWLTYNDDKQVKDYELTETDTLCLFKGNNITISSPLMKCAGWM